MNVAVAGDHLGPQRLGVRVRRGRFTTKPPLAPVGTITAFLTIWAFISPSTSVRKSSRRSLQRMPAAGDRPTPQVHALDAGRAHPDLEHRPGQRQVGDDLRVELEGEHRPGAGAGSPSTRGR